MCCQTQSEENLLPKLKFAVAISLFNGSVLETLSNFATGIKTIIINTLITQIHCICLAIIKDL